MPIIFKEIPVSVERNSQKKHIAKLAIDTNSHYCVLPAKILEEMGVEIIETKTIPLALGVEKEVNIGLSWFWFFGKINPAEVIFSENEQEYILGVNALDVAGAWIDSDGNFIPKNTPRIGKIWRDDFKPDWFPNPLAA